VDLADLVRPAPMSWLRAPALHMAAIGAVLFGAALLWSGRPSAERPRIVVPPQRVAAVRQAFLYEHRRPPTAQEASALVDHLVDQEVLYQYALKLGMHEQPAARRRLAQIADFVEANPHDASRPEEERAATAVELGLHHGDVVTRRVLIDSARRLIRAVVLTRQPDPAMVQDYLAANRELFMWPARTRITHVEINGFKWRDGERRAALLLERIRRESITPEAAPRLGDQPSVPSALPPLSAKDLQTRFGVRFEGGVRDAPRGAWAGPVASRFGHHLVWVHERQEAALPPFETIRASVEQRLLHKLADDWLAIRLRQLRAEFDIVVPPVSSCAGSRAAPRRGWPSCSPQRSRRRRSSPTSSRPPCWSSRRSSRAGRPCAGSSRPCACRAAGSAPSSPEAVRGSGHPTSRARGAAWSPAGKSPARAGSSARPSASRASRRAGPTCCCESRCTTAARSAAC
jgi:hypothetical protein